MDDTAGICMRSSSSREMGMDVVGGQLAAVPLGSSSPQY